MACSEGSRSPNDNGGAGGTASIEVDSPESKNAGFDATKIMEFDISVNTPGAVVTTADVTDAATTELQVDHCWYEAELKRFLRDGFGFTGTYPAAPVAGYVAFYRHFVVGGLRCAGIREKAPHHQGRGFQSRRQYRDGFLRPQ